MRNFIVRAYYWRAVCCRAGVQLFASAGNGAAVCADYRTDHLGVYRIG